MKFGPRLRDFAIELLNGSFHLSVFVLRKFLPFIGALGFDISQGGAFPIFQKLANHFGIFLDKMRNHQRVFILNTLNLVELVSDLQHLGLYQVDGVRPLLLIEVLGV